MAIYFDDLKPMLLYKKQSMLPIIKEHKKTGSAILLLTPNYESSNSLMNNPLFINHSKSYMSYYIEKDITYTINHENKHLEINHYDDILVLNEQTAFREDTGVFLLEEESVCNDLYCQLGDTVIFFNEMYDEFILNEAMKNNYNTKYKALLYNDRIRNNKAVFQLYDKVKGDNKWIQYTFIDYERYKQKNLFIDLYYYNQTYLGNNNFTITKSLDMYFEFIKRFINDKRIEAAGYTRKTIFVPVNGWNVPEGEDIYDYLKYLNPISAIYKKLRFHFTEMEAFKDIDFLFVGTRGYFKMPFTNINEKTHIEFVRLLRKLISNEIITDDNNEPDNSPTAIAMEIVDKLEGNKGIKINNLTGGETSDEDNEKLKAKLVDNIAKAASDSNDVEDALSKMDDSKEAEEIKNIIDILQAEADDGIKISASRANRINTTRTQMLNKKVSGRSIKDIIDTSNKPEELKETVLPIDTINDEWKHLKAVNFEKTYDLNADIYSMLLSLSDENKRYPVSILDIDVQDTSTSEDSIDTWTVKCESYSGKRFTLRFDIPRFRDDRFLRLRGNEKIYSGELPSIPICKIDDETSQIASCYKKILIQRYNTSEGKSNMYVDKINKALEKYKGNKIKIVYGDNTAICSTYVLPIDYIDLASKYSKITIGNKTIYFNQDQIRSEYKVDAIKGIPWMVMEGKVYYYDDSSIKLANHIAAVLCEDAEFNSLYEAANEGRKYTYARASIASTHMPVILILAYDLGLTKALQVANIRYTITDKKNDEIDPTYIKIKFADGYLNYESTYENDMLMYGLKDCGCEDIEIATINSKVTWLNVLDSFGGRIKSDTLDNFADLMYDPITIKVSSDYELPVDYHEALVYATYLLVDNKYAKQVDLATNRYRTNEVVAVHTYQALATAYQTYALMNKHGRDPGMSMKQSVIIDSILSANTTSDLSIFQPLTEIEAKGAVSFKGAVGMNSERAYTIDKRGYSDSMINIIGQATGFAGTVGVNRQMTVDPKIVGGRGYFKTSNIGEANSAASLTMTESVSPYTLISDDPFRNCMTFVQTSKHTTPIQNASPQLVTTGADEAMPYLTSNMFCHKAKRKGKVTAIVPDKYLLVTYDDGGTEFVDLREQTMKNSDGGFYIPLTLITNLKVGDAVKENTILAYDKKSFSNKVGKDDRLAYNAGHIAKFAILVTEDGFEDSGVCSEYLTEEMSSEIEYCKDKDLEPDTNVLYMVKIGQEVDEGEPMLIFQRPYDEEDANLLIRTLNGSEDEISEIGRITIKAKTKGVIQNIKIYRTADYEEFSPSLLKIIKNNEKEIKALRSVADKAENDSMYHFDSIEKLPMEGKLKNVYGVKIEIFIKCHDKLSVGDKIVCNSANKMVLMKTYRDEDSPYTAFRPNEAIDAIGAANSVNARLITSNQKLGLTYKALIELKRSVCDIMGVPWKPLHEININK